ncbi:uncharacterized protein DS421_3g82710 [Arachis hypogaea]|nr:uncharacterized protein DS421_3g82710 [Arachis hypogaea]
MLSKYLSGTMKRVGEIPNSTSHVWYSILKSLRNLKDGLSGVQVVWISLSDMMFGDLMAGFVVIFLMCIFLTLILSLRMFGIIMLESLIVYLLFFLLGCDRIFTRIILCGNWQQGIKVGWVWHSSSSKVYSFKDGYDYWMAKRKCG